MEKIKVCLVSDTVYDVNGVSRFIQDFSKEALHFEKEFHVITSTTKTHYEEISNIINIKPMLSMKMPFYKSLDLVFPNFFKIKKQIKELNPDLLHISTPGTVGLCALISAKILKIPVVEVIKEVSLKDEKFFLKKEGAYKFMRDKSISHSFLDFWHKNEKIYKRLK